VRTVEYHSFNARGSNHFQMKNDKNAGKVFKRMYEGIEYGIEFKQER